MEIAPSEGPGSPGDVLLVVRSDWRDSSRIRDGEEALLPGKHFHPSTQSVLQCKLVKGYRP